MRVPRFLLFTLAWPAILSQALSGQGLSTRFDNQLSTWTSLNFSDPVQYQAGGRYIPGFSISQNMKKDRKIDAELSVNTFAGFFFKGDKPDGLEKDFKPYRAWIRYATPRLEIRAGLQKINFGSASILRPLMWFDKMDSRDPLQLTDGVYSLLGRYYFQNNANIWIWALYGNKNAKGWEIAATKEQSPELGGRFQFPVPGGEAAISFHRRMADYKAFIPPVPDPGDTFFPEEKIALDGKLDLGPGLSFEFVLKHNDPDTRIVMEWETQMNIGLDYTFGMGNGINLATEYFRYGTRTGWKEKADDSNYSVVTANYPLNLMNTLSAMVYYNWNDKAWFRLISLQRKYDFWSFYLIAFWNPDTFSLYGPSSGRNLFAGKGIQIMAVINN
jgi:hypothetical protein